MEKRQHCILLSLPLILLVLACSPASTPPPSVLPTPIAPTPSVSTPASAMPAPTQPAGPPALVLVNGTLVDGSGADPVPDAVVVIREGRITAAGPRGGVAIPQPAQVIDVQGATILPGFINAHVHNAFNLGNLAAWAQAGVTTVRDLGSHSNPAPWTLRDEAAADPQYARLIAAGPFITRPGGYPIAVFGGVAVTASTPEEARQAADSLLDQGADIIKISLESGQVFHKAPLPMLSREEVAAIATAAHLRGTLIVAHVTVAQDLQRAYEYGVDDIGHMVVDPVPDELIQLMVADGVFWEPTLELWQGVGGGRDRQAEENLGRFVAAGGQVALGTDYAGYYTPFQLGMPIHEMEGMLAAGMSPMQIIVAGTRNAARVCNRGEDLGTLEVGKVADVLAVQGDPLQDIHALANVRWVIHSGVVIRSPSP